MNVKKIVVWLLMSLLPMVFLACSGGGGGSSSGGGSGSADSMVVADKVSVVDAKLSGSVAGAKPLLKAASVPAGSDYTVDKTNVYVEERSVQMFGTINEILCMIGQTEYDAMLNKGAYTAQIDINQCSSARGDASQAGQESSNQSSGATAPSYESWTVESSRADNNSPQIVKAWIHQEKGKGSDPPQIIQAKVTITEGKSATNPIGIFTVQFKATPPGDPSTTLMKGLLKAERDAADPTKILLKFVDGTEPGDPMPRQEAATLNKNADGTSGSGTAYRKETWNNNGTLETHEFSFNIAYNTDLFLRSTPSTTYPDVCLDRNTFDMSAWQYGLYNAATGARVVRNSGFPIKFGSYYGNVGYWGLWLPNGVTLNNGDTVYKHDYQANTDTPYTVFVAKGKLKKHTKKNFTLADVKNIPLDYGEQTGTGSFTNYRVVWDGVNNVFKKIAQMPQDCGNNCTWADITTVPTPTINFSQLQWSELNFWSQSLGGQVRVPLPLCTYVTSTTGPGYTQCSAPSNTTPVVFYQEDIVYPTDTIPASFACYDQCPQATSTAGIDVQNGNFVFYNTWNTQTGQSQPHTYTFDKTTMLLMDGVYSAVATTTTQQNQYGVMSGALFDPNTPGLAAMLDCNWDGDNNPSTNPQTCGWKAWSALDVFYTWETGMSSWNQFTAVKDSSNTFVIFEPPLQVEYVHSQTDPAAPDRKYDGTKFFLEYSGFGQLNGIPAHCVDMDSGAAISCDQGNSGKAVRWVPEFFIPAGTLLQSGTYMAKPLEMEQRMRQSTGCAAAGLATSTYTLPTIADWVDPAVGAEPVVTAAPAVVGGVVQ